MTSRGASAPQGPVHATERQASPVDPEDRAIRSEPLAHVLRDGHVESIHRGHVAVVAALLEDNSFPIDHVNNLGWTALLEAIILGNGGPQYETVVQMLVTAGCDVNIADKEGVTPLQHAVYRGFRAIAWRLMQAGAK